MGRRPYDVSRTPATCPGVVPATECLADVVVRMLPYWYDAIAPDLLAGKVVLVAAHGNSLRALIKHLDEMTGEDIAALEIPTGVPIVYELDKGFGPSPSRWPLAGGPGGHRRCRRGGPPARSARLAQAGLVGLAWVGWRSSAR